MNAPKTPTLDALAADLSLAAALPVDAVEALLAQVHAVEGALLTRLLAHRAQGKGQHDGEVRRDSPLDQFRYLSTKQVADLIARKEPYVRELCRAGRLPARKEGKYWLIPVDALHRWKAERVKGLDREGIETIPCTRDRQGGAPHPKAPGAYTVEIRVASRRERADHQEVGSRCAADARPGRAASPASGSPGAEGEQGE